MQTTTNRVRSYSEMLQFKTYGDRLNYLSLSNEEHISPRSISNEFYKSKSWLELREVIHFRDAGFDLGVPGMFIEDGPYLIHHINPLTEEDIQTLSFNCFDPENLITTSDPTHNIIHYKKVGQIYIPREPGDTSLW